MLDIPMEDLLSLLVIIIAIVINLIVGLKSLSSYKSNRLTQTLLFALTAFFMAIAMGLLVIEKIFLSTILHDGDMGMLFGMIAIILSGFAVVSIDGFAFNMVFSNKWKLLTSCSALITAIYLMIWVWDPERTIVWSGTPESGEIALGLITSTVVYFTLVPLLIIPVLVFFYYALKVRSESPVSSRRSWVLGFGILIISIAYIFEIIGLEEIIQIQYLPTFLRTFFILGALLLYWGLFKLRAKQ